MTASPLAAVTLQARELGVLFRAGVLRLERPDRMAGRLVRLKQFGPTLAGAYAAATVSAPDAVAVTDERTTRTYAELDVRVRGLAAAFAALGVDEGSSVALLGHNSVGFVEALVATSRLGADALLLSTFLSPRQAADVLAHERPKVVVVDPALLPLVEGRPDGVLLVTTSAVEAAGVRCLDEPGGGPRPPPPPPPPPARLVVLTSGTTGTPKGARRPAPRSLGPAAAMLSRLRLRRLDRILIAPPLFHTWGLGVLQIAPALAATVVLRERPDPVTVLSALAEHRCTALVTVPVILDRLCALDPAVRGAYDTSSLRVVASSGSALSPELTRKALATFGDTLYNIYGSTENSWATIADPADLRAAPGTAGRPPLGTRLAVLDLEGDAEVTPGQVGRIFVGNHLPFEGYTDGTDRARAHGLMATGDRGFVDPGGRLMVVGRDDDLVVSGAEKIYPQEVEGAVESLPGVLEVAVVGRPDPEMGQQLVAYVVRDGTCELTEDAVRDHVRARLARFAVPRQVHFVDELPRTPTGKVLRRLLP